MYRRKTWREKLAAQEAKLEKYLDPDRKLTRWETALLLEQVLTTMASASLFPVPAGGWLRAIRYARELRVHEWAGRQGCSEQNCYGLEKSEVDKTIRLDTLEAAARALDCKLAYVLVPEFWRWRGEKISGSASKYVS